MTGRLAHWAVAAVLSTGSALSLANTTFPTKPIRIIVNASPGAALDATTRVFAEKLAEKLGQPVVVENNAGAAGLLGIRYVKGAPADGYTLLAASNTLAQAPAFRLEAGYDLAKDFVGIGPMTQSPLIMVGPTDQPDKTLAEFLARAKANPDKMSFASGGVGTTTYMAAALLLHQTGIKLVHVPYKGSGAAVPDVIGGRINMMFDSATTAGQHVREGKLRAFGVTSTKRLATLPDVPTLAEQGVTNYNYTIYLGLVAPAATPKEVVQRLSDALRAVSSTDAMRETLRRQGQDPWLISSEEFTEVLKQDLQRTTKVAADMGIQKQ